MVGHATTAGASSTPRCPSRRLRALRQAEAGGRGQPVPRLRRHALDGGAHRQGAERGRLRVPQAEGRGRGAGLRQRQPRHQRRPLLPEPGVRALCGGHAPDAQGRAEGGLVPRPAPHASRRPSTPTRGRRPGRRSRRTCKGTLAPGQAGRHGGVRHEPRGRGADRPAGPPAREGPLHDRRRPHRLRRHSRGARRGRRGIDFVVLRSPRPCGDASGGAGLQRSRISVSSTSVARGRGAGAAAPSSCGSRTR